MPDPNLVVKDACGAHSSEETKSDSLPKASDRLTNRLFRQNRIKTSEISLIVAGLDRSIHEAKIGADDTVAHPDRCASPRVPWAAQRSLQPFRDWFWTGRTMRSLKVKAASENRVTIGFVDPNADRVAHVNNVREKAFGLSPNDRLALRAIVLGVLRLARVGAGGEGGVAHSSLS